jgi:hypothetical protein
VTSTLVIEKEFAAEGLAMNTSASISHESRGFIRWAALAAVGAVLAGCGSSDGSVGVGSGQDPDPVALDFPIAYTKGPLFDEDGNLQSPTDLRDLERFNVGTDLYLLDRASPSAVEQNITFAETQGLGDVMGVEISVDGTRVLFAMRGPFDPNLADEDQPTWNIWEYDIPTASLRRVIASDITAEAGHDIYPQYLADGRIIFSSTRQRQAKAILLDEGKPQFDAQTEDRNQAAFVLHVMDEDGQNLHQVSFNQSHDLEPTMLDNGKVMFSRWDAAGNNDAIHLFQMNPDGSELELLYGAESHDTGTNNSTIEFIGAREMIDGQVMAIVRPFDQPELGGDIVVIDVGTYVEITQPNAANAGMPGPAHISATPNVVRTDNLPSAGGRFSAAFPLWDGTDRVLTSWAICRVEENSIIVPCTAARLADPNVVPAPPLYGIWMYDPADQTQLPVVIGEEGVLIGDIVAAQPRPNAASIPDQVAGVDLDTDLAAENVGILNIRSVYDIDGVDVAVPDTPSLADPAIATADQRPARFLRVEKAVSIPDDDVRNIDNTAFGPNINQGMREIVGYAPIEPDGSIRLKVPANVALAVSVLDANGRRITGRHQSWIQVLPGDELTCDGCHSAQSGLSHGRSDSFAAAYAGAPNTGVPFANTVSTLSPDFGETMAETRTRISCQTDCAALQPSLDLVYEDVWTDPNVRTPDAMLEYRYSGLTTPAPTALSCIDTPTVNNWSALCRSIINYEIHIHPLWSLPRTVNAVDVTCSQAGCHAPVDAAAQVVVPAAQLDLTDGLSPQEMDHFNAYRELVFTDDEQIVVNGALQDRLVQNGVDADGNPIFETVPVAPSMSAAGANASTAFFSRFDAGGSHAGYLSPDELRLLSEWLDIGAQYFNNPFDAPEN